MKHSFFPSIAAFGLLALGLFWTGTGWSAQSRPCGCYCGIWLPAPCSDNACKATCEWRDPSSTSGSGNGPVLDPDAERRAREEAERQREENERRDQQQREAERQREFERDRDAAATKLKGSTSSASELKGLLSTGNTELKGSKEAGGALKSLERHGQEAGRLEKELSSEEAKRGFDTGRKDSGTLVYPGVSGRAPSFVSQIPPAARNDSQVKQMLEWYQKLEGQKAETEKKIAEIKQQQKTNNDPLLAVKLDTLANNVKQFTNDQVTAKEAVKKRVKDLGLEWNEAGTPAASDKSGAKNDPANF